MHFKEMDAVTKLRMMARLVPVLARIGQDTEVSEALKQAAGREKPEHETYLQQWSAIASLLAPVILDRHAEDLCEIIAIMTGKTVEEVNAPGNNLFADLTSFLDADFMDFFTQSGHMGGTTS